MGKVAKVPVIMQLEALECGAACLCMIAAYYKKWIPLTKVRKDCGVSRDGSVAKNMLNAGRSYGFEGSGYRVEPSCIEDLDLPAIIHWDFNHFVVLCGVNRKKNKVYINDPARGRVVVTLEEFDKSFTGIALCFTPGKDFKPEGKPKSIFGFVRKCLKNSFVPFVLMVIVSLVVELIGVASPIFGKVFVDDILSKNNPEWLFPLLGIMLIALVLKVLVGIINSIYWIKIEGKFAVSASAEFMWKVLRLPLDFFSQRYIGDIAVRQESASDVALTLIQNIAPVLIKIFSLAFYLIVMINYSLILTCIGLVSTILDIIVARYTSKRLLELQRASVPNDGKLSSITYSGFGMIETIKSTGAETGYFERWAGYYAKQNNASVNLSKFVNYVSLIPEIISNLTDTLLLMSGVYLTIRGNFTIGMLTAFQGFLSKFWEPVNDFIDMYKSLISVRCDMERIEDVLDYQEDEGLNFGSDLKEEGKLKGYVEIKDLTFGYNKLMPPLIENFSLSLTPGKKVAIVGGSGSGKSTIAKLVMGLYTPWQGEITFDNKKKSEIDCYKFHSSVSMVDQEKTMFNDTIRNNIKMWDESIEDFAMIIAAKDAKIHSDIISRPDGYSHKMRESGSDFSGGQCQRIEIARAFAQEPTIMILDEATSALDAKTEQEVMNSISNLGCTCIVVAHRLSTVRDCDEIIVLDKGKVVERGTHEELINSGGKYKELVTTE